MLPPALPHQMLSADAVGRRTTRTLHCLAERAGASFQQRPLPRRVRAHSPPLRRLPPAPAAGGPPGPDRLSTPRQAACLRWRPQHFYCPCWAAAARQPAVRCMQAARSKQSQGQRGKTKPATHAGAGCARQFRAFASEFFSNLYATCHVVFRRCPSHARGARRLPATGRRGARQARGGGPVPFGRAFGRATACTHC